MVDSGPAQAAVRDVVWRLAESLSERMGLVLVDVTYAARRGRGTLRIVLDRSGGITLQDIEAFHRAIDPLLDEADPVPTSYNLEVSSPGAERRLQNEREFHIFEGRAVRIVTREPIGGRAQWDGRLAGVRDGCVVVQFEEGSAEIPLGAIQRARLRMEIGTGSLPRRGG